MKTGVCSLVGLVTVFVAGAVSVLADEGQRPILVGSDGSVRFENPVEVEYTPTGLSATAEALKYPEAVKRLIAEGARFPAGQDQSCRRTNGWVHYLASN